MYLINPAIYLHSFIFLNFFYLILQIERFNNKKSYLFTFLLTIDNKQTLMPNNVI